MACPASFIGNPRALTSVNRPTAQHGRESFHCDLGSAGPGAPWLMIIGRAKLQQLARRRSCALAARYQLQGEHACVPPDLWSALHNIPPCHVRSPTRGQSHVDACNALMSASCANVKQKRTTTWAVAYTVSTETWNQCSKSWLMQASASARCDPVTSCSRLAAGVPVADVVWQALKVYHGTGLGSACVQRCLTATSSDRIARIVNDLRVIGG